MIWLFLQWVCRNRFLHINIYTGVNENQHIWLQRAKKVVSDSPGLVDFSIGLVNSVINLPDGQVMFFEEFEEQKNCEINSARQKAFGAGWNDVWASKR